MKKIILVALMILLRGCDLTPCFAGSWERAVKFVLAHEGGYINDGGWESNYGLCSKWYPKLSMKTLSQDSAVAIYYRDYWCYMGCDTQADSDFALLIFDTAVLFGQPTARMMLKDCIYDMDSFMYMRIDQTAVIVLQHPEKVKYLSTWMKRTNDLQKVICCH